jgi:hypothetical protein
MALKGASHGLTQKSPASLPLIEASLEAVDLG